MPFRNVLLPLTLVLLGLSACGDADVPDYPFDGSDEEQIHAVVGIADAALQNRDGYLMCREVFPRDGYDEAAFERCGRAFTRSLEDEDNDWPESLGEPENIEIHGSSATASVEVDGDPVNFRFPYQQGRWWMRLYRPN
jgi:hypothetical protein